MEIQNFLKFDELNDLNTPALMKQYREFKLKYPDFILLFMVGSFYETYFDDAILFSKITGAILTRKKLKMGAIPMAGISKKNIESYINILLKNNHKIVLVDEKNEKDKNNLRIRKVSKIYTRGSLYELEYLNPNENNYLASIYKEKDGYKFAYADVSTGSVYLSEGSFNEIKCELSRINPVELLIPLNEETPFELYEEYKFEKLREDFYKGENENKAYIGLINYLNFVLGKNSPKLGEIKKYDIKKLLLIDFLTRKNLELIKNAYNNKREGSLLWALDNCKTSMGKRLLSSLISTPLYDIDEIKKRQNLILKFNSKKDELLNLKTLFTYMGDVERLASKMSNKTINPLEFLALKSSLEPYKEIFKLEKNLDLNLNNTDKETEKILKDYYYILDKTFEDDLERVKNGDYIKRGANEELDFLYTEYENLLNELKEYEEYLKYKTNIKSLKINFKQNTYSIEINLNGQNSVMADFAIIQRLKNSIKYTTPKLLEFEEKISSTKEKMQNLREIIFENLKKYSTEMTRYIRDYSKIIAIFDVCISLLTLKDEIRFPVFNNAGKFKINGLKHFAAEKILKEFKSLDVEFKNSNLVFLTGVNGVGKSTLLKAIGNLFILAQAGFIINAEYAEIPLIDKLCAVLSISDELINKKSTHQMQMQSIAYALENLDEKSLLLMDEIGKNTSYKEGVALSVAIIQYLAQEKNITSILSTHFIEIKDYIENINNKLMFYKIEDKDNGKKITNGIIEKSLGIEAAKKENLPDKIIAYAKNLAENVL